MTLHLEPARVAAVPAGVRRDAGRIAELVSGVLRLHGSMKSRLTSGAESEFGQLWLLVALAKDGPRRAGALAEQLCADPSTVSRQVAAMVRAGLVERRSDPDDGRASLLAITAAGRDRVGAFADTRAQAVTPIVGDWPESDREVFIGLLQRYVDGLERHRDAVMEKFSLALQSPVAATAAAVAPPERDAS